jgi:hypothetical protein
MADSVPVDPKRSGVKAVLVEGYTDDLPPGACLPWDQNSGRLHFACPGCGQLGGVNCGHPKPAQGLSWDIVSGSPADPATLTLTPSINCVGCCGWHGFLTNGVFNSA